MMQDTDIESLTPTTQVKAAAGVIGGAGFLYLILAMQSNSILRSGPVYWVVVPSMLILGALMLGCAFQLSKMRAWASTLGMLVAGIAALAGVAWLVFTAMNSVFSLMALMVVPASIAGSVLAGATRGTTKAADDARERLADSGLDAGI